MTMTAEHSSLRIEGLDLARFFAFVGMVIVNFKIVMGAGGDGVFRDCCCLRIDLVTLFQARTD